MLKAILLACAITFLPVKSVLAIDPDLKEYLPEQQKPVVPQLDKTYWGAKPVQCGPVEVAFNVMLDKDMVPMFAGMGWSNSHNHPEPLPVKVALYINMVTQEFAVIEIGSNMEEACFTGFGTGFHITNPELENFIYNPISIR